jgi:hypothetical protein
MEQIGVYVYPSNASNLDPSNPAALALAITTNFGTPTLIIFTKGEKSGSSASEPPLAVDVGSGSARADIDTGAVGTVEVAAASAGAGTVVLVVVDASGVGELTSNPGTELSFSSNTANKISNSVILFEEMVIFFSTVSANELKKTVVFITKLFNKAIVFCSGMELIYTV